MFYTIECTFRMFFITKVCSVWLHFLMQLSFGPWFPGDHIQSILTAFMELSKYVLLTAGSQLSCSDWFWPGAAWYLSATTHGLSRQQQHSCPFVTHFPTIVFIQWPASQHCINSFKNQPCEAHLALHFTISGHRPLWVCHLMPQPRTWSTHSFQHFATGGDEATVPSLACARAGSPAAQYQTIKTNWMINRLFLSTEALKIVMLFAIISTWQTWNV